MKRKRQFSIYAVAVMVGYIVGAGIFALPFVIQRMGYIPAVGLLMLLTVTTAVNCLALAEILLRTKQFHCLPGLAKTYLGGWGKIVIGTTLIGHYGTILAYAVLAGSFLKDVLQPLIPDFDLSVLVFLFLFCGALFILKGYSHLGIAEIPMAIVLGVIIIAIAVTSLPEINTSNYLTFDPSLLAILPAFGVILFSLEGSGSVFPVRKILQKNAGLFRKTVFSAYGIVFLLYLLFSAALVGVFGGNIPEEAVVGIRSRLGPSIELAAVIFGILAVLSSYIVIGTNLKQTLNEVGVRQNVGWLLVWLVPLILYLSGFSNFIAIISMLGMFLAAVDTTIIVLLLRQSRKVGQRKPEFQLKIPIAVNYLVAIAYIVAAGYGIAEAFSR